MSAWSGTVTAIVISHFAASFAALGMPPFFPLILNRSLHNDATFLAGVAYVLPTLLAALSGPWWGVLSDRFGKKALLLRAQFGLAASFLLAGFAKDVPTFLAALALQGLLGGTFAASNAYLATLVHGQELTRTLTLMQGSARAALVVAPAGLGMLMAMDRPIEIYRYLALLPFLSALIVWFLPAPDTPSAPKRQSTPANANSALSRLAVLQFAFAFGTVVTFPYFVAFVQSQQLGASLGLAGMLFGLPHVVYLLSTAPLTLFLGQRHSWTTLAVAFPLLSLSLAAQAFSLDALTLAGWRVMMGLAMTAGFVALHSIIAQTTRAENAGRAFGWLDSASKWGGVAAGFAASAAADAIDLRAPFLIGSVVLTAAALWVLGSAIKPRLESPSPQRGHHG